MGGGGGGEEGRAQVGCGKRRGGAVPGRWDTPGIGCPATHNACVYLESHVHDVSSVYSKINGDSSTRCYNCWWSKG